MIPFEQPAFILHTRPYQEHKLLIDCLTRHNGRVGAVAYLPKSNKSAKKSQLQLFYPILVSFSGSSSLKTLKHIESDGKSIALTGNALYSGFYLNELMVRLLPEQMPCEALFEIYTHSLVMLANNEPIEPILRKFESVLLDELGLSIDFSPVFEYEIPEWVYIHEHGLVPAKQYPHLASIKSEYLIAIANQQLTDKQVLSGYKIMMRQVINGLLGGKPLNSRALFKRE